MLSILLAIGVTISQPEYRECDVLKLNHTYRGKCGEAELVQVIFWRWHQQGHGRVLRAHGFWLPNGKNVLAEHRNGRWEIDCGGQVVKAKLFRETHTDSDPERDDLKRGAIERFSPIEKGD